MKPTPTSIFLLLALAAAAVWGAYFALESMMVEDELRAGAEVDFSDAESWEEDSWEEEAEQEQDEPSAREARLAREQAAFPEATSGEKPAPAPAQTSTPPAAKLPAEAEQASAADREEEVQAFVEKMEILKERFFKLQKRFYDEERDLSWARGKEKRVRDVFEKAGQTKLLVSVECRTTLCRAEARVDSPADFHALWEMPDLSEELSDEVLVLPQRNEKRRTLVSYFAKHGYTLERLAR